MNKYGRFRSHINYKLCNIVNVGRKAILAYLLHQLEFCDLTHK